MGAGRALCLLGVVVGCSATEGPLLVARDDHGPAQPAADAATDEARDDAGTAVPSPATHTIVQPGMRLQYQLVGAIDTGADVDFFVLDLFEASADEVLALHQQGRVVAAYVAAGSHEPWRADAGDFPASALGEPLPNYPSERWLDVRDQEVRRLQTARIQLAADKGFDGVHLSSLDAYAQNSGFSLSADDQLEYARFLAQRARALGLAAGLSSAWELADQLAPSYDFAIHQGCLARGDCAELDPLRDLERPVFDLETTGTPEEICPRAAALGLAVTLKRDSFDAWLHACP